MVHQGSGSAIVLALVAGLVGGVAGNRLLATDPVVAQEAVPRVQVVTCTN